MKVAHMHYEYRKFESDIKKIKSLLIDDKNEDYLLKNFDYKENLPITSLEAYFLQIWQKIEANKNLFIPDEKKLISIYICETLKKAKIDEFTIKYDEIQRYLKVKFMPTFVNQLDVIYDKIYDEFTEEAKHYDNEIFDKELLNLKDFMRNRINALCNEEIKKACNQAIKDYNRYLDQFSNSNKLDNIYEDLRRIVETVKKDCENRIKQCKFTSVAKEQFMQTTQILEDNFKRSHAKFLANYLRFAENELLRSLKREFNELFKNSLNYDFWENINKMLFTKTDNYEAVARDILLLNYQISQEECGVKIGDIIKHTIIEFKEYIKQNIKDDIEIKILSKFCKEIVRNEKGIPYFLKDEKEFHDNYAKIIEKSEFLLKNLRSFNLKLYNKRISIEINENVIIFDNNQQFDEKRNNIINELASQKEKTLNEIVRK